MQPSGNRITRPQPDAQPPSAPYAARRRLWIAPLVVLVVAVLLGMQFLYRSQLIYTFPEFEEAAVADHLANGHGFISPFAEPGPNAPPSSWSPPVYPTILAAAFRLFDEDTHGCMVALGLLNCLCYGAVAAGLLVLGRRLWSPMAGWIAALLFLAHPMFVYLTSIWWDSYLALAIFIWSLVWATHLRSRPARLWSILVLGAGLGILVQTNASYVFAVPGITLVAVCGQGWRRLIRYGSLAVVGFAIAMAPWTVRNYLTFHRLIFVRGGANLEIWFGNQPGFSGWLNAPAFANHPGRSPEEQKSILAMGENAYFDWCGQRFRENYHRDPAAFWQRTATRSFYLFMSDPKEPYQYRFFARSTWHGYAVGRLAQNGLVAILGIGGALAAWWLGWRTYKLLGLAVLSELPFTISSVWDRQCMPLRSLLVLLMAFVFWALWERWRFGRWPTPAARGEASARRSG